MPSSCTSLFIGLANSILVTTKPKTEMVMGNWSILEKAYAHGTNPVRQNDPLYVYRRTSDGER